MNVGYQDRVQLSKFFQLDHCFVKLIFHSLNIKIRVNYYQDRFRQYISLSCRQKIHNKFLEIDVSMILNLIKLLLLQDPLQQL